MILSFSRAHIGHGEEACTFGHLQVHIVRSDFPLGLSFLFFFAFHIYLVYVWLCLITQQVISLFFISPFSLFPSLPFFLLIIFRHREEFDFFFVLFKDINLNTYFTIIDLICTVIS